MTGNGSGPDTALRPTLRDTIPALGHDDHIVVSVRALRRGLALRREVDHAMDCTRKYTI